LPGVVEAVELEAGRGMRGHEAGSRAFLPRTTSVIAGTSDGVGAVIAGSDLPTSVT
jgi:hypothetical protein